LGLMRFINLAHGAFAMTGGYLAAWLARTQSWGYAAGVAAAVLLTAALGALLEAVVLRRLYRRSELDQVLFTIGLAFVFVAATNLAFGPQVQLIPLPPWLAGSVDLGMRTLPMQRMLVIAMGAAVALLCGLVVARSRFGVWLRAAVDNKDAAAALGINIRLVSGLTFAAGCGLAALGGVLGAELMPLEPYYALKYLVLVLVVVAVGGMGSIAGTVIAALFIGLTDSATGTLFGGELAFIMDFAILMLILIVRPRGLFGYDVSH